MDAKTLEWMNQRTNKGNDIQEKLNILRKRRNAIWESNTVRLEFSDEEPNGGRISKLSIHTGTVTLEILEKYNTLIAPVLIAAIDKEIAELETEFAEL